MTTLKLGSLSIDVIKLQLRLDLIPTAYFDERTLKAVKAFQKANKLTPDGVVGPKTRVALGLSHPVPDSVPLHPLKSWIDIAEAEVKKEIRQDPAPGKHHPSIMEYHKATKWPANDDETPWCSAFVNWVIRQSGRKSDGGADAKSWLTWGVAVTLPERGDIVVIKKTVPTSGAGYHVGFFISLSSTHIRILGGNQGDMVRESNFPLKGYDAPVYRRPGANKTAMYLKFGNVKGSVTAEGHEGQIQIATLNFDVSRNVSMEAGNLSNRESSKPTLSQIAITKLADISVASLFQASVKGTAGQDATIVFVRTGKTMQEFMTYKLKDCIVSGYTIVSHADEPPVEGLSLSYSAIEVSYKDHDASNKSGSPQRVAYDVKAAKVA